MVAVGDTPARPARYDLAQLEQLERDSRVFIYAGNTTSYMVKFAVSEDDDPDFLVRAYQMFRTGGGGPQGLNRVKQKVLSRKRRVAAVNRCYQLARRLHRHGGKPRILFASEMRPRLEGNLLRSATACSSGG